MQASHRHAWGPCQVLPGSAAPRGRARPKRQYFHRCENTVLRKPSKATAQAFSARPLSCNQRAWRREFLSQADVTGENAAPITARSKEQKELNLTPGMLEAPKTQNQSATWTYNTRRRRNAEEKQNSFSSSLLSEKPSCGAPHRLRLRWRRLLAQLPPETSALGRPGIA